MHLPQIQICYPFNPSSMIQTTAGPVAGVGGPQNIMIPSTGASGGPSTQTQPPIFYQGLYTGIDQHTTSSFFLKQFFIF
jgi:hypothetical protein